MPSPLFDKYDAVWCVDFEFHQQGLQAGGRQVPVCMVAIELHTGRRHRLWQDELWTLRRPPFDIGPRALYVAYLSSAELHCHLALGWPLPVNVLDLYVEFRNLSNGLPTPRGRGLLGAMHWFGLDTVTAAEKADMRELVLSGGPWSAAERLAILDYCESDVVALLDLLPRLAGTLNRTRPYWVEHALLRGRYMRAVAAMEFRGIPIDMATLTRLMDQWAPLRAHIIEQVGAKYPVFEGLTFKAARFERLLTDRGMPWPRTESGQLALDQETFREQERAHPWVAPIREVRDVLSRLRLHDLQVGPDGRNRALLGVVGSKTGRNQPSNSRFIFGPAKWLRGLIKPEPGTGIAYVDFASQENALAAALSNDQGLKEGYLNGDPYLDFAIRAGLAPPGATKETHKGVRQQCKAVVLGTQYGMGAPTLSQRLGVSPRVGIQLLRAHQEAYPTYWRWVERIRDAAVLAGHLDTVYGWRLHVTADTRPTTLQNYPCQANGAEMLRLSCAMAYDEGLGIIAPVHDAILLEAPLDVLDRDVARLQEVMAEAGRVVMGGFPIRSDAQVVRAPHRYMDEERGREMWDLVWAFLEERRLALADELPETGEAKEAA